MKTLSLLLLAVLVFACTSPPQPGDPGYVRYTERAALRKKCVDEAFEYTRQTPGRHTYLPKGMEIHDYCRRRYP